jgi:UDP-N-acetylglucosamine diphosphorylase / glucose-1-phosphate thymidylyltransferase / UDP-N-acetylgalactosamine diphosphorylase / glucosamine-1-phosphate N-acetyltransferase / galactosamine-1-phosphate N-acetyltransferase
VAEPTGDLVSLLPSLPAAVRACLTEPDWWTDELRGLRVIQGLTGLNLPARLPGYRTVPGTRSPRWDWAGHALVHRTATVHQGVSFFGPVLVGPGCEVGPHASIFGPTVVQSGAYVGPSAEIRRSLLLAGAEISHLSFVGHSVIGRNVRLGAFFCSAVRNLRRGTVHILRAGALMDTGEERLGCVIADGTETGVHTTVMPGRRLVASPVVAANSVVIRNC